MQPICKKIAPESKLSRDFLANVHFLLYLCSEFAALAHRGSVSASQAEEAGSIPVCRSSSEWACNKKCVCHMTTLAYSVSVYRGIREEKPWL